VCVCVCVCVLSVCFFPSWLTCKEQKRLQTEFNKNADIVQLYEKTRDMTQGVLVSVFLPLTRLLSFSPFAFLAMYGDADLTTALLGGNEQGDGNGDGAAAAAGGVEVIDITSSPSRGHPKIKKLEEIVIKHFQECKLADTRVMVFSQVRLFVGVVLCRAVFSCMSLFVSRCRSETV
jgi:hypothetical protein